MAILSPLLAWSQTDTLHMESLSATVDTIVKPDYYTMTITIEEYLVPVGRTRWQTWRQPARVVRLDTAEMEFRKSLAVIGADSLHFHKVSTHGQPSRFDGTGTYLRTPQSRTFVCHITDRELMQIIYDSLQIACINSIYIMPEFKNAILKAHEGLRHRCVEKAKRLAENAAAEEGASGIHIIRIDDNPIKDRRYSSEYRTLSSPHVGYHSYRSGDGLHFAEQQVFVSVAIQFQLLSE